MAVSTSSKAFTAAKAQLVASGYLANKPVVTDEEATRAVMRFQQRAQTKYRLCRGIPAQTAAVFTGNVNAELDEATLAELTRWAAEGWSAPIGYFNITPMVGGGLREDVFAEWTKVETTVAGLGGTISGPYGNTKRALGKAKKSGASSFSFHTMGRAIDLPQERGGGRAQQYYVAKEAGSDGTYWRIYCKTDKQDASQGTLFEKGSINYQNFSPLKEVALPKGYYLDITLAITQGGKFERIKAQSGWEAVLDRAEWWHFQFAPDKQPSFLMECELIGYGEADLLRAGYAQDDLDHKPG